MPLPKLFNRKAADRAGPGADEAIPAQQARVVARRRLAGAVVLLALGVVGFPLLFDTKPRPTAVDVPMSIAAPEPPRAAAPSPKTVAAPRPPPPADAGIEGAASAARGEPALAAGTGALPSTPAAVPERMAAGSSPGPAGGQPIAPVAAKPATPPVQAAPPVPAASAGDRSAVRKREGVVAAAPAQASVAAAAASASAGARFVVQVGAYSDLAALRDVRQKVERMGLKTYTQEIETDAGKRTRLRVGPFPARSEAEQASQRLKGAGLPANLLVL
jgi:DedD protein